MTRCGWVGPGTKVPSSMARAEAHSTGFFHLCSRHKPCVLRLSAGNLLRRTSEKRGRLRYYIAYILRTSCKIAGASVAAASGRAGGVRRRSLTTDRPASMSPALHCQRSSLQRFKEDPSGVAFSTVWVKEKSEALRERSVSMTFGKGCSGTRDVAGSLVMTQQQAKEIGKTWTAGCWRRRSTSSPPSICCCRDGVGRGPLPTLSCAVGGGRSSIR